MVASPSRDVSRNTAIVLVVFVILALIASSGVAVLVRDESALAARVRVLDSKVIAIGTAQEQIESEVSDVRQTLTDATAALVYAASGYSATHELLNAMLWTLVANRPSDPNQITIVHNHARQRNRTGYGCESCPSAYTGGHDQPGNYHWQGDVNFVNATGLTHGCRLKLIGRVEGFPVGKDRWKKGNPSMAQLKKHVAAHAAGGRLDALILIGRADRVPLGGELSGKYGSNAGLAQARAKWVSRELRHAARVGMPTAILLSAGPLNVPAKNCDTGDDDCDAKYREKDRSVEVFACLHGH